MRIVNIFLWVVSLGWAVAAHAQQVLGQTPTQGRYSVPPSYAAQPQAAANAAALANGQDQSLGMPAGRPAPAAPMPSPLPPQTRVQQALEQVAPLAPDEVILLRQELLKRQRAAMENVTTRKPARPTTSAENLDLTPGSTPPVIRVAVGQGTVISFVDAAGRPWEIQDGDLGLRRF